MRTIETSIVINAPIEIIWRIFINFPKYPEWNTFFKYIKGSPKQGQVIDVCINTGENAFMKFKPTILEVKKHVKLRWLGRFIISGLFDGEHIFMFEQITDDRVRFIHEEKFKGILVPLFWKKLYKRTVNGFELYNLELKRTSEYIAAKRS